MEGLTKQQLAEKSGSYRIFTCLGTKLKIKGCSENTSLYRNAQENLSNSVTICKLHKDRPWFRSQQKKIKDQIQNWLIYLDIYAVKVLLVTQHMYGLEISHLL